MARRDSRIAFPLLKELFEACAFAVTKLRGVPSLGPTARLAVKSLVFAPLTPSSKSLIAKVK